MSFLGIDIGNSRLKWTLYEAPRPGTRVIAQGAVFLESIDTLSETDWRDLPAPTAMIGCNVAGEAVRHRLEAQLEQMAQWEFVPRWIHPQPQLAGVSNGYDHPTRLGADRWAAMIGARWHVLQQSQPGPALVVMVGTAVTVDALDAQGHFCGGLILPGHGIMLRALEGGTAGLRVPTGQVKDFPSNTSDAITSSGTYAITGAIERLHQHLSAREHQTPRTFVSGGAAWKVCPYLTIEHELHDALIFDGLLAIASTVSTPGSRARLT